MMGLAGLLGRKPPQSQDDISSFKAQAYGSTTESMPPVLGTNPIPGNGVNAIGSNGIHQLPRKKSRPQLPLNASHTSIRTGSASPAISISSAAPAPLVPRLRSSSNLSRPNTAPDGHGAPFDPAFQSRPKSSGKARSRRDSLRQTVSFLRKSGSHGDFQSSHSKSNFSNASNAPPVPPIPAAHSPALSGSGTFPRSDTASLSLSASYSLSDSLNRGSGFVDILDAQGEIRPSNFRSRLEAAGARDYGEDVAERNIGANGVNLSSPAVTAYYATTNEESFSSSRTDNLDYLSRRPRTVTYPKRVDSFDRAFGVEGALRHEIGHDHKSNSRHRPHPLQLQPIISNSSSDSAAEPPIVPRVRNAGNKQSARQYNEGLSIRRPRDSTSQNLPRWPLTAEPAPSSSGHFMRPHAHHSVGHREGRTEITYTGAPTTSFFRSSDYPEGHMTRIDRAGKGSAFASHRAGRLRSNSRPSSSSSVPADSYPRTRSLGGISLPPRPNLDDITEHIPPRTSSKRNWSISSSNPPTATSDWSSDLFHRPISRHTADTSIPPSGSVKSLSLGNLKDALFIQNTRPDTAISAHTQHDDDGREGYSCRDDHVGKFDTGKGKEPARKHWSPHDDEFGLNTSESELSSDQRTSPLYEERLLFRDGGYSGSGLPGLFDGRNSPTPSDWSLQTMTYDQALDLITPGGLHPPNTPSQRTTFGNGLPTLPSFDTSSNDGGSDATSESAMDAKVEAKMAMRVRRELKRRERLANIEKRHGKQASHSTAARQHHDATPRSRPQHV